MNTLLTNKTSPLDLDFLKQAKVIIRKATLDDLQPIYQLYLSSRT
ncbi:hypothetical protein [Cyanothece sp. BG0011]|nr:hypothetical protein [Cyanothece sp. BG0011]